MNLVQLLRRFAALGLAAALFAAGTAAVAGPLLAQSKPAKPQAAATKPATAPAPAAKAGKAAKPVTPVGGLTTKELEDFVKTIEDKDARERFVARLKTLIALKKAEAGTAAPPAGLIARMSRQAERLGAEFVRSASFVFDLPRLGAWFESQYTDPERRRRWIEGLWKTLLVIAAGLIAELLARALLARPRRRIEAKKLDSRLARTVFLSIRTLVDLVPMGAFAAAAYGALPLLEPSVHTSLVALTLIYANVLVRAIRAVARAILVPKVPSLRVVDIPDETAAYLFVWVSRFANVTVYSYFVLEAALFFGLPTAGHGALVRLIGLVVAIMTIVFIVQNRKPVAAWLGGAPEETKARTTFARFRNRVGDVWHGFAILYVVAVYVVWALNIPGGFQFLLRATILTAIIAVIWGLTAVAIQRLVARIFHVEDDLKRAYPHLEERANRYTPVVRILLRTILGIVAGIAILQVWNVDVFDWLASELGQQLVAKTVTILAIVVAAVVIWEVASTAIEKYLARQDMVVKSRTRSARMRTLLPLGRKVLLIVLIVMNSLIVLSELGVNIGPLLAGAGVLGLAIGFGAQTLVKDLITGVFNLIEDTIAVGDVIEVKSHIGTVESVSVRSVRLRDYSGIVHTIPFSEVTSVKNMTKEYSYFVLDLGVAYRENVDEVMATLREIDDDFQKDADFAPSLLAPLEISGLNSFDASAVVIRARLKTRPGMQWAIGRELNRRIKATFDARGIEIPFPHTTIYFGEDKEGKAPPVHVRTAQEPGGAAKKTPPRKPAAQRRPQPADASAGPATVDDKD